MAAAAICFADATSLSGQKPLFETAAAPALSFSGALELAFARSPRVLAMAAEVKAAESELLSARTYPFNPLVEGSRSRRDDGSRETHDREIGISQELELAGQRGKRVDLAVAALEAVHARVARERQVFAAEVGAAFVEAIRARDVAALASFEREIVRSLADYEQRRLEAGAGTLIDLNVARAASGRAERQVELADAEEVANRAALAALVGLAPAELPRLAGELPESWPSPDRREAVEERALAQRLDLVAARLDVEAAFLRLRLERSLAAPNLILGVARGREGDSEDLSTLSAGVSIPIFQRNQGGIAAAEAREESVGAELAIASGAVRRDAVASASRYAATVRALELFQSTVAGTLAENLDLMQKSFASGKLRASEVLVFRREFIDSRRELIQAKAEAWLARISLDLATGDINVPERTPPPATTTPSETSR